MNTVLLDKLNEWTLSWETDLRDKLIAQEASKDDFHWVFQTVIKKMSLDFGETICETSIFLSIYIFIYHLSWQKVTSL